MLSERWKAVVKDTLTERVKRRVISALNVKEAGSKALALYNPTFSPKTTNRIEGQRGQDTGARPRQDTSYPNQTGRLPKWDVS